MRGSLQPFLRDTLSWLTGTATIKDVNAIKTRIYQLIATQHNQQETLVHVMSPDTPPKSTGNISTY